jgi:hypothetical protein
VAIAASSGQNDGGVFEFSFRDERYMPFEGAGAVSEWTLSLPSTFRMFDYGTIADVILRVSYTALEDAALRTRVEAVTGDLSRAILGEVRGNDLSSVISLRRDLPDTFARLMRGPANTDIPFQIDARQLPWFIGGRPLVLSLARAVVRTKRRAAAPTMVLSLNGAPTGTLSTNVTGSSGRNDAGQTIYSLFASDDVRANVGTWFGRGHTLRLTAAGNVAGAANSGETLDSAEVLDVLLEVRYKVAP